jgi:hypothetical protein
VEETVVETYNIQYLIQQITNISITSHLFFGGAPLTFLASTGHPQRCHLQRKTLKQILSSMYHMYVCTIYIYMCVCVCAMYVCVCG